MDQTLNTATPATGLGICENVTTGDIGIANTQTSGAIDIGTFGSRSGQITIGGDGSTAPVRIDAGLGGINGTTGNVGPITWNAAGALTLSSSTDATLSAPTTVNIVSPTEGQINIGNTLTTGQIYIGDTVSRTGDIQIGNVSAAGQIYIESSAGVLLGDAAQYVDLDKTGGNIEIASAGNLNLTVSKIRSLTTTEASSSSNGSVNFKGGVGFEKNIYGDSNITAGGDWRSIDATRDLLMFNGNTTGDVTIGGGMTTADINLGVSTQTGQVKVNSTLVATSGTTGAFTCRGGASFTKLVQVAGGINLTTKPLYTQTTSNSSGVTANSRFGNITTYGSNISAHASSTFTVTNSEVTTSSIIVLTVLDHTGAGMMYPVVFSRASGSFILKLCNVENTTLTGAGVIGFSIQ